MFEKEVQSPHGMGTLQAVFEAKSADYSENEGAGYSLNLSLGLGEDAKDRYTNTSNSLNYEMYYWISVASRDAFIIDPDSDNKPMLWVNDDPLGTMFHTGNLDTSYDALSPEMKAEKHCEEVILAS